MSPTHTRATNARRPKRLIDCNTSQKCHIPKKLPVEAHFSDTRYRSHPIRHRVTRARKFRHGHHGSHTETKSSTRDIEVTHRSPHPAVWPPSFGHVEQTMVGKCARRAKPNRRDTGESHNSPTHRINLVRPRQIGRPRRFVSTGLKPYQRDPFPKRGHHLLSACGLAVAIPAPGGLAILPDLVGTSASCGLSLPIRNRTIETLLSGTRPPFVFRLWIGGNHENAIFL